jgi:hypothetical protein
MRTRSPLEVPKEKLNFFPFYNHRTKEWRVCTDCRVVKTRYQDPLGNPVCQKCAHTFAMKVKNAVKVKK